MMRKRYLKHSPKRVVLAGMGPSIVDMYGPTLTQEFSRDFADEVWVVNMAAHLLWHDLVFWMDDLKQQQNFKPKLIESLNDRGRPIMTTVAHTDICPTAYTYPIDEVGKISCETFGKVYLTNSIAHAIAYAIHKDVKELVLYGCDFTYPDRNFAEAGRACVEAWATLAMVKYDIKIILSSQTSLFDAVSSNTGVYGYAEQPEVKVGKGMKYKYRKKEETKGYKPEDSSGVKNGVSGNVSRAGGGSSVNVGAKPNGANGVAQDAKATVARRGKGVGDKGSKRGNKKRHASSVNGSGAIGSL